MSGVHFRGLFYEGQSSWLDGPVGGIGSWQRNARKQGCEAPGWQPVITYWRERGLSVGPD